MHTIPSKTTILLAAAWLPAAISFGQDKPTAEQIAFFESKIRPVLIDACYECHSNEGGRVKAGLALDSREGLRLGGDSGVAVEPGNPEDSLLWISLTHTDPDYEMPKKKLPDSVVADFKKWIEMGAPDPRINETFVVETEIDIEEGKKFWSFQKPVKPAPPAVENADWPASPLDRFVLAKLEEANLTPAPDAKPATLLRRLFFDLIGLPPSPQQARAFFEAWKQNPDEAIAATVDSLLASPQFGERWGRHWLDVARYGESTGKDVNMAYPSAWRYRDYVIDSFNADKPYDRFLIEQVAGDLLPVKSDEQWQEHLIATGFLAIGTKGLNEQSARQFQMDVVDEQIDALTQATLGLTVACARCHDHKFDPIPTADYYALAGIFLSTETFYGTVPATQNRRSSELLILPVDDPVGKPISVAERTAMQERLAGMEREIAELRQQRIRERQGMTSTAGPNALQRALRLSAQSNLIRAKLNGHNEDGKPKTFAMGVQDRDRQIDATVLVRGEIDKPAQQVGRGFVQVLEHAETPEIRLETSGRLELAGWLTSKENPLTARVMANRVFQHLFGKGIVASPNNFGTTGQAPTHPELLDHLAVTFMENEWSVKSLIREIVLSHTYRMGSGFDSENYAQDPDNNLLWRANQRRLDAEAIRDAMLAASGNLDLTRPRGSLVSTMGDLRIGQVIQPETFDQPSVHRSVYLPIVRGAVPEALALFDFAEPGLVSAARETTNVPSQALYLMNNAFVSQQAKSMGARIVAATDEPKKRANFAFFLTYGRAPTQDEIASCIDFFQRFMPAAGKETQNRAEAEKLAMATFCQALFSSAEFRYLN